MPTGEKASEYALFAQVDPAGAYEFLTCVGITGNISIPKGDLTIVYCPSIKSGEYEAKMTLQGEPGLVTFSIQHPLEHVFNWALELKCPINLRVHHLCGGDRPILRAYRTNITILEARATVGNIVDPTALGPDANDRVMANADFGALKAEIIKQLTGNRQTVSQTQGINDIDFLPPMCRDDCSVYTETGQKGYAVLDTDYAGVYGDVIIQTEDHGATWALLPQSPFTSLNRSGNAVKVRWTGSGNHRIIVAGDAVGGAAPEISYSDDEGVSWNDVEPSAVAGQGILQMCWDSIARLWACSDDGYIFYSTDLGESWSASEEAVETTQPLYDIVFYDADVGYCVGGNNVFLRTLDGGTWGAVTGPTVGVALLSVAVNRFGHVFVGTNDARIFRSINADGDCDWVEINDWGNGSINCLRADPDHRYWINATWDNATPVGELLRSEDGGHSFRRITTPTNEGLDALCVCDPNVIYIGGEPVGGTSFIGKFIRSV